MHWGVAGRTCGARVGFGVVVGMVLLGCCARWVCGGLWFVVERLNFELNQLTKRQKVKPPKILEKNYHSTKTHGQVAVTKNVRVQGTTW